MVGFYDYYARISVMCIPFSWCGMTVHTNDADTFLKFKTKGSSLCLANHGSRIDWVSFLFSLSVFYLLTLCKQCARRRDIFYFSAYFFSSFLSHQKVEMQSILMCLKTLCKDARMCALSRSPTLPYLSMYT